MGFLLTSASKRDAMGRKPRRKIFAIEGLKAWEKEVIKSLDCALPSTCSFIFLTGVQAHHGGPFPT